MQGVDLIITITDRDRCEDFTAWFRRQGIPLVLTALSVPLAIRWYGHRYQ